LLFISRPQKNGKRLSLEILPFDDMFSISDMLRYELTQMASQKKNPELILDTPEHVESENINLKIGNGSSLYQLFYKRDLNS
jgi:hypothetical protein